MYSIYLLMNRHFDQHALHMYKIYGVYFLPLMNTQKYYKLFKIQGVVI